MAFFGYIGAKEYQSWQGKTPFLPAFSFYERHESAPMSARPEDMINAVGQLNMNDDRVIRSLMSLRRLPTSIAAFITRHRSDTTAELFGLNDFTPLHQDARELSLGLAGQFWRPGMGVATITDAHQFLAFDDPHAVKLVVRFQAIEQPGGKHVLRTETFIFCPNRRTTLALAPYWAAIRPASGWIRRRMLALVQRHLAPGD